MNINTREDAKEISDKKIYISRSDFPDKDAFYLVDLIGFNVKDESDNCYGYVRDIIKLPTNDSLLIDYNNKELMIPIIDDFIKFFDYDNKCVIIKNSDIFINLC